MLEERKALLIGCDFSSLVVDTLYEQAVGEGAAVACFYFDFAAREEQSPTAILGSVLKQIVDGPDEVPERIVKAFQDRRRIIGSRRLALAEIVEFLQDISFSRCTFMCIDALDECREEIRPELLNSLNQILQKSPGARLFLTGRPHIRREVVRFLDWRTSAISITPTRGDITIFLRAKLREDAVLDAMDANLEEEVIQNILDTFPEM